MQIENKVSRTEAILEVSLLLGGIVAYLAVEITGVSKRWLIIPLALVLVVYFVLLVIRKRESLKDYGIRLDNILGASLPALEFTLFGVALLLGYAWVDDAEISLDNLLGLSLLLYPLYGIAQQMIFQGILHRRLLLLLPGRFMPLLATSVLFSAVHIGDLHLVLLTLVAGLCWSSIYQAKPNVITLGISHGVLASLAYPIIIGKNPIEMF